MDCQTPLARVRGLGSAREGSHHWWRQRVSAIALFPLGLWFAFCLAHLPEASYADVVRWTSAPWNAVLLISFILLSFFHAMLGLQIIIEDYVHNGWLKLAGMLAVRLVTAFLSLASAFAVLHIVLAD